MAILATIFGLVTNILAQKDQNNTYDQKAIPIGDSSRGRPIDQLGPGPHEQLVCLIVGHF